MRTIGLFVMLCISLVGFGRDKNYGNKVEQDFSYHRIERNLVWEPPIYSKSLSKIFKAHKCNCVQHKYVALFSAPYKGYIRCEILPIDRKIGILGEPIIYSIMFGYNEEGIVEEMFRHEVNVD